MEVLKKEAIYSKYWPHKISSPGTATPPPVSQQTSIIHPCTPSHWAQVLPQNPCRNRALVDQSWHMRGHSFVILWNCQITQHSHLQLLFIKCYRPGCMLISFIIFFRRVLGRCRRCHGGLFHISSSQVWFQPQLRWTDPCGFTRALCWQFQGPVPCISAFVPGPSLMPWESARWHPSSA